MIIIFRVCSLHEISRSRICVIHLVLTVTCFTVHKRKIDKLKADLQIRLVLSEREVKMSHTCSLVFADEIQTRFIGKSSFNIIF